MSYVLTAIISMIIGAALGILMISIVSVTRKVEQENSIYREGFAEGHRIGLRGPQPDPITGLVPCGCGGKAETHELFGHYSGTYMTDCKECATGTTQYNTEKESQDAWNTAMGWKGGAE